MHAVRRCVAVLGLAVLAVGTVAPRAAAAGDFVSDPAPKSESSRAPGWVTMAFSFQVDPSTAKMLVLDKSGRNVTSGSLVVEWTNVTSQLRSDLQRGTYTVHYRVSRPDGEPMGGTFQFAYGKGDWSSAGATKWTGSDKEPEILKNPDPNATVSSTVRPPTPIKSPSLTPKPSASPSESSASPAPEPTPSAPLPPVDSAPRNDSSWMWGLAGAIVLVAVVAAVVIRRRSQSS